MSGSIERERFRPGTAPTQVAGVAAQPIARAAPVRAPDPVAPQPRQLPRRPDMSNGLTSLAAALSGIRPVLQGAAELYFQGQRAEERQTADADATLMSVRNNAATWAEAVRNDPGLADRSPYYRQIYEERLARQSVLRRGNELHAEYWGSDIAGSEDPTAVMGWLSTRMGDLLDQYRDSPAQRAAAAEEVRNQAQALVRTHQQNAVRNLVQRNEDSLSSAAGAVFDAHAVRGGGRGGDATFAIPDNIRSLYEAASRETGIPARILMAQGYHESGGFAADVLSGARRGSRGEIGIAQALPTTAANPGYNVPAISERDLLDPAKAIRWQAQYLAARGRAAGVRDWNDPQQALIGLASYNGTGQGSQGYARDVWRIAERQRGATSGPGGDGPNAIGLGAELQRLEAEGRAQGLDRRRMNQIMTQATAAAMVRHGRVDFATLGDMQRPDGTPGFGTTAEGRLALEQARQQVLSRQVTEENLAYTRQRRAQQIAGDALAGEAARSMLEQMERGETPRLSIEQLARANRLNPDLIGTFTNLQSQLRGVAQAEDARSVADLELRVNTGEASVRDVMASIGTIVRDPETIRRLTSKALEQSSDASIFRNPVVTQIIRETQEAAAGVEGNGVLKNYGIGIATGNSMRESIARFQRENPQASQVDIINHLREEQRRLVPSFNRDVNIPGYEARARDPNAADPRQTTTERTAAVEPNASFNWQRRPAFGSVADLETAYSEWRRNPAATSGPGAIIARWVVQGGVRDPQRFFDTQRRLLQQQERNSTR